jgi:hypothetical protein
VSHTWPKIILGNKATLTIVISCPKLVLENTYKFHAISPFSSSVDNPSPSSSNLPEIRNDLVPDSGYYKENWFETCRKGYYYCWLL